jgi:hypothetical protein
MKASAQRDYARITRKRVRQTMDELKQFEKFELTCLGCGSTDVYVSCNTMFECDITCRACNTNEQQYESEEEE